MAGFAGCSQDWLDVNTDPNNPSDVQARNVLPAGIMNSAYVIGGNYNLLGGFYSQYWAQGNSSNQYKYIDSYGLLNDDFQEQWREMYAGSLNDLKITKEKSAKDGNWSFFLMATVIECYDYQVLVDLYDKVPFTEGLAGLGNLSPKYDNGTLVYDSLIARIDYALAKTTSTLTADEKLADILFQGDMSKWIAFANTLKLKIYMRQMYARPTVAQNGIAKLYADGAKFLNVDASVKSFANEKFKDNPLYALNVRNINTSVNLRASATIYKYYQSKSDPRLANLCGTGVPLPQGGYDIPQTTMAQAGIAVISLSPTDPSIFISKEESYLLQAEAVANGWGVGNDNALYDNGVSAAFERYGYSAATFIAPGGVYAYPAAGTFAQKQEAIIMAKWAAMARTQGLEAFLETNRTHFPKESSLNALGWKGSTFKPTNVSYVAWTGGELLYSLAGSTGGKFPKRLLYTQRERQANINCPTEEPITKKVWWDVKP